MHSAFNIKMDCPEINIATTEEEQLEPLLILEEGDEIQHTVSRKQTGKAPLQIHIYQEDTTDNDREDRQTREGEEDNTADNKSNVEGSDSIVEETEMAEKIELIENANELRESSGEVDKDLDEGKYDTEGREKAGSDGQDMSKRVSSARLEGKEDAEGLDVTETDKLPEDLSIAPSSEPLPKLGSRDRLSPKDAEMKVQRLSQDFPDALYELLYTLQEGRRLNDQRCSFRREGQRRRCYSEPSTPRHSHKVLFSSMTSLQKEEFFDLVATSQSRRLDDQRAELQSIPSASLPPQLKIKLRKSSCKGLEVKKVVPTSAPKEDLYNMILNSQSQGRLEEQRSTAPGPMDDEDFFSLLLRVQGGRLDEQRTELPVAEKY